MKHSCFFLFALSVHIVIKWQIFMWHPILTVVNFLCFKWQNVSFKWFYFFAHMHLAIRPAFFQLQTLWMHIVDAWFYFIISISFFFLSPIHSVVKLCKFRVKLVFMIHVLSLSMSVSVFFLALFPPFMKFARN